MLKLKSKSKTLNLFALLCLGLTLATTHAQRFVKVVNTVDDLVRLNPFDVHTNVFVADPVRGGLFSKATRTATNQGTAFMSTNSVWQWNRQFSGPIDVRWFGAKGDTNTVDTTAIQAAINASPQGATIRLHKGVYFADGLASTNINFAFDPGAVLKHVTNATGHLLTAKYSISGLIEGGMFDGNMGNQSTNMTGGAGNNWWSLLKVMVTNENAHVKINANTFTNFVYSGVRAMDIEGHLDIEGNIFINGREHGGIVGLLTTGIHVTQPTASTNSVGKLRIIDNDFIQSSIPTDFQRGPGGIIVAGNEFRNSTFTGIISGNYFKHIGQTWVGNHIAAVDLYEECYNFVVSENIFDTCLYDPAKIQNINEVVISNNQFIGDNDPAHNPGVLLWYNPQQREEDDGDKHGCIISGNMFKDYPKAQAMNLLNSLTTGNATMTDVLICFNRTTNVARAIKLGDPAGGEHYGPLTIMGNHFFVNGTEANAIVSLESFHGDAIVKNNFFQVSSTAAVGSHGFLATIDITGARFHMDGNVIKTKGVGYYPIAIFGADYIDLGKQDLTPETGGEAVRIDSRTEGATTYNNGTVWYNAQDIIVRNGGVMTGIIWATVTNRIDNDAWFIINKANEVLGVGVTPTSNLNPIIARRQTNGYAKITITNDPDLGNTSAAAGFQAISKDSSGNIGAFPSDYIGVSYRDSFAITAGAASSGGLRLFTDGDKEITLRPNETLVLTITDDEVRVTNLKPLYTHSTYVVEEAYGVAWATKTNVPTKKDVYNKVESLGSGGSLVPAGTLLPFAGSAAPTGYLLCDGSAVSRTTYATLFAVIGETWGVGDGVTTFNVPDMRGRTAIGTGTGAGLTARTIADTGGEETHVLTEAELPSIGASEPVLHNWGSSGMSVVDGEHRILVDTESESGMTFPYSGVTDFPMLVAGSDDPHNVMQPWAAVTYIIKI